MGIFSIRPRSEREVDSAVKIYGPSVASQNSPNIFRPEGATFDFGIIKSIRGGVNPVTATQGVVWVSEKRGDESVAWVRFPNGTVIRNELVEMAVGLEDQPANIDLTDFAVRAVSRAVFTYAHDKTNQLR